MAVSVTVKWTGSRDSVANYRILRALGSGSFGLLATVKATVHQYVDKTAQRGKTYHYYVKSVMNGMASKPSNTATVITK